MTPEQCALAESHLPLARRVARVACRRVPMDYDELRSLALVGLCEAAISFEASRGVPFEVHARRRMRGQIGDAVRAVIGRTTKHAPPVSLEALLEARGDTFAAPVLDYVSRLHAARVRARVLAFSKRIDPRRRLVVLMRAKGWSDAAIARDLGLSAARVSQIRVEMWQRFQEAA